MLMWEKEREATMGLRENEGEEEESPSQRERERERVYTANAFNTCLLLRDVANLFSSRN